MTRQVPSNKFTVADIPTVKKHLSAGLLSFLALLCVLLGSLFLLSGAAQNTGSLGAMYNWLLFVNGIGLFLILAMIGVQARRLIRQRRADAPGSRLTLRITAIFVLLSLVPVTVVYYFSQQFIHRGIDTWMDVRTEHAIEASLDLTRASLDLRMREHLRQTQQMMDYIGRNPLDSGVAIALDELRQTFDAEEVVLLGESPMLGGGTEIVAYSHIDPTVVLPHIPDDELMSRLAGTNKYVGLDPGDDGRLYVRVMVRDPNGAQVILQALFASPTHLSELANAVQEDYARFQELSYLRQPLKDTFTLTLRLVLLFSILSAVWAAFYAGRRMTAPIRALAKGTQAVAEGDYDLRLATSSNDDLGFLVRSFNDMTKRIAQARDQVHESQQETEQQREYLETILAELSSGVLAFAENEQLRTANQAAESILGFSLMDETQQGELPLSLSTLAEQHPSLHPFINTLQTHLSREENWREEITLTGPLGRRVLLCRGTPFSNGHVVVFDDITGLIQAQRDSAWGEVARRLAHEIKNPLTPIQLSAERIRHKFLHSMNENDAKILDRTTNTIVQQVESMKAMVNSFAEYARMPKMEQRPVDLNKLVAEVTDLYRSNKSNVDVLFQAADNQPTIEADEGRIRQLLHNLIKNGLDALDRTENAKLLIVTDRITKDGALFIELRIEDNGPGFSDDMLREGFQPYVTDKPTGTGLGLAIVKKITEEHSGMITLANGSSAGAIIRVRIPEMRKMA